jgi:hypothetical protein
LRGWIAGVVLYIRAFYFINIVIFLLLNIARILRIVPVAVSNGVKVTSIAKGFLDASWPYEL